MILAMFVILIKIDGMDWAARVHITRLKTSSVLNNAQRMQYWEKISVLSREVGKAMILCKTNMKATNDLHEKRRSGKTFCCDFSRPPCPDKNISILWNSCGLLPCPALAFGWSRRSVFGRWRISLPLFLIPLYINGLLDNLCYGSRKQGGKSTNLCSTNGIHRNKDLCGLKSIFWKSVWELRGVKAILGITLLWNRAIHCLSVYAISSPFVQLRPVWSSWQQQSQLLGINFIPNISM